MPAKFFIQPDETTQVGSVYKGAIDDSIAVMATMAAAFNCHQNDQGSPDAPDLTVRLEPGVLMDVNTGVRTAVAAASSSALTAPSSNPRKDIVSILESTGAIIVTTGAESGSPIDPDIPTSNIPIARINWQTSQTEITNTDIDDIRPSHFVGRASVVATDMRFAFLLIAENSGDRLNMVDGIADPFTDESDVDTASSPSVCFNQIYDAAKDSYENAATATASAVGEWNGSVGGFTFSGADILNVVGDRHIRTYDSFTGDFSVQFTCEKNSSSEFGFYPISADGSFNATAGQSNAGLGSLSGMFGFSAISGRAQHAASTEETIGFTAGDVIKWERVGSAVQLYKNASLVRTMTATSSVEVRIFISSNTPGGSDHDNISWWENFIMAQNMTLQSNVFTASYSPNGGRIHIQAKPIDGGFTFSGADILNVVGDRHIRTYDSFTGDFSVQFTCEKNSSSEFGFYPISADGSFNATAGQSNAGLGSLSGMFGFSAISGRAQHAASTEETIGFTAGDVIKWERVGSAVQLYKNASLVRTMTATSSVEVRIFISSNTPGGSDHDNISWWENLPATASAVGEWNGAGVTINTDLMAEISRDGGASWTTATLVEKATLADGTVAYEDPDLDLSGQPSGTSIVWRVKTLNNKEVEIHGVVLQWN